MLGGRPRRAGGQRPERASAEPPALFRASQNVREAIGGRLVVTPYPRKTFLSSRAHFYPFISTAHQEGLPLRSVTHRSLALVLGVSPATLRRHAWLTRWPRRHPDRWARRETIRQTRARRSWYPAWHYPPENRDLWPLACLLGVCLIAPPVSAQPQHGTASWYSCASTKQESSKSDCLMANGRRMDDEAFTAASWDYPLGTRLEVCAYENQHFSFRHSTSRSRRCQVVRVFDRGPAKRLVRTGRIIDLSKAAFQALAPLSEGVIPVEIIEEVQP